MEEMDQRIISGQRQKGSGEDSEGQRRSRRRPKSGKNMDIQFVPESSQQCHEVCPQEPQHVTGTQQVTESGVEHTQLAYR